jgi:WhiB family redox-sensing transcriptional regulator
MSTDWRDEGLCREVDPELFFPEKGEGNDGSAKRICRQCEVSAQCLGYALANCERYGIWGGLTERERRRLKRGRSLTANPSIQRVDRRFPVECGTERGYRRHLADGEPTCGPCRKAHGEYRNGVAA